MYSKEFIYLELWNADDDWIWWSFGVVFCLKGKRQMSINLMTSKDIREKFSRPVISFASDKSEKKNQINRKKPRHYLWKPTTL